MRIIFAILLVFGIVVSCKSNGVVPKLKATKIKTILILGNSITETPPFPQLGWNHRWGMAASALDSDYVHQLTKYIHSKDKLVVIKFKIIADWERTYQTYNLSKLDPLQIPDMIIMRIAENVPEATINQNDFITYYGKLINHIDPKNKSVKIITGSFWNLPLVNRVIRNYADKNHLPFVNLMDLSHDPSNKAIGKFPNKLVSEHPSDKGMRLIAQRIWNSVKIYFE